MPNVGDTVYRRAIRKVKKGRGSGGKLIWRVCIDCGKGSWGELVNGEARNKRCKLCFLRSQIGSKNPNWKGGIWLSKLKVYTHYKNSEYKTWRERVFRRDNYTCQECGIRGVFLHPHHIKSYTYYPEYRYDVDNGITLCVPCHHQLHFGN